MGGKEGNPTLMGGWGQRWGSVGTEGGGVDGGPSKMLVLVPVKGAAPPEDVEADVALQVDVGVVNHRLALHFRGVVGVTLAHLGRGRNQVRPQPQIIPHCLTVTVWRPTDAGLPPYKWDSMVSKGPPRDGKL